MLSHPCLWIASRMRRQSECLQRCWRERSFKCWVVPPTYLRPRGHVIRYTVACMSLLYTESSFIHPSGGPTRALPPAGPCRPRRPSRRGRLTVADEIVGRSGGPSGVQVLSAPLGKTVQVRAARQTCGRKADQVRHSSLRRGECRLRAGRHEGGPKADRRRTEWSQGADRTWTPEGPPDLPTISLATVT